MKLKYYIRTLGLGIFVTALLMGFATTPKTRDDVDLDDSSEVLSNQVLSEVASTTEESKETQEYTEEVNENKDEPESELMNESGNELKSESEESKDEAISEAEDQPERESASESESQQESESESQTKSETNKESENPPERESKPQETEENTTGEPIESERSDQEEMPPAADESFASLEIRRGDSSDKVSRKLQELGLIEDAKSFDRYLCDNGYDKRISVGSYEIPTNSSEEEIALIISGKKK